MKLSRFVATNVVVVTLALVLASAAGAATLTYPGVAPCNTTLQACITAAASGDIIEIATNTPIDENLAVGRSLTLRPAAGFAPVIGGSATTRVLDFGNIGVTGGPETVLIEGLHFTNARVDGFVYQASGHSITVRNCVFFLEIANNNTPAIEIDTRVPLTGLIEHNQITSIGQGVQVWAIVPGAVSYRIERNTINTSLPAESYQGISLQLRGSGTYQVGVFSNVIQGVSGCNCGLNGGIVADIINNPQVVASITNNTVEGTQTANGVELLVRDAGANVTFNLFNNIASHSQYAGFSVQNLSGATVTLNANQNDSFANGNPDIFTGFASGTVLNLDPHYVNAAAGDLRLQYLSPVINIGVDAPSGGNSSTDADGAARIFGPHIDLGAYERAPAGLEVPTLGATALVILCLAVAGLGFGLLRRTSAA